VRVPFSAPIGQGAPVPQHRDCDPLRHEWGTHPDIPNKHLTREVLVRLVAMMERLSLYLVLVGSAMIVTGAIVTVALLVHRANCDGVLASQVCRGYTNSIHWVYPLIALGAVCFIAAGLSATNQDARERVLD
jgi:hypothetical protein